MQEIERKFLLENTRGKAWYTRMLGVCTVTQHYLVTGETEIQIRKVTLNGYSRYFMSMKNGEAEVSRELYETFTVGSFPLTKERITVELYDGNIGYLDIYYKQGFATLEVKFNTMTEARKFVPPSSAFKEVTDDASYKAQNIWLREQEVE